LQAVRSSAGAGRVLRPTLSQVFEGRLSYQVDEPRRLPGAEARLLLRVRVCGNPLRRKADTG
jgi:hypothetical protein